MYPLKTTDPTTVGPYRLAGRLGAGGMGVVYLGVSATADTFAVKMISPGMVSDDEFRARFAAEVDTLKTVHGSRVARLERADLDADPPWLATEFVPGQSLQTRVEVGGPLDVRAGAMLGALLVEGLRSVHEAGLVHRDLKPANIMLGPAGPIVIDFGLAVLREREAHLTATGQPVGTLAYMSPEQAHGVRELTTATDVYALGATLVYALTGHTVYQQNSPVALLKRIDDPLDLPNTAGVPDELVSLVDGMLGYDRSSRPGLDVAFHRMIDIVVAGGVTAEMVRVDLTKRTYVEEPLDLPGWAVDPVEDDTDRAGADPTRLVPEPVAGQRPVARPPVADQPTGGPVDGHGWPPSSGVPVTPGRADVGWLVDEMRTAYAREAAL